MFIYWVGKLKFQRNHTEILPQPKIILAFLKNLKALGW